MVFKGYVVHSYLLYYSISLKVKQCWSAFQQCSRGKYKKSSTVTNSTIVYLTKGRFYVVLWLNSNVLSIFRSVSKLEGNTTILMTLTKTPTTTRSLKCYVVIGHLVIFKGRSKPSILPSTSSILKAKFPRTRRRNRYDWILGVLPHCLVWRTLLGNGRIWTCGPCTEIHYNQEGDHHVPQLVNMGNPEVLEIWNLIFTQFNKNKTAKQHVDTGMGLDICDAGLNKQLRHWRSSCIHQMFSTLAGDHHKKKCCFEL